MMLCYPLLADSTAVLDKQRIHNHYLEGNFDQVMGEIGLFNSLNKSCALEDSIFIARHLGVVFSANPETLEKGKYYLHQLLALDPSADLVAMYVSQEIEKIFEKVKVERESLVLGYDDTPAEAHPPPDLPPASRNPTPPPNNNRKYWVAGSAVAATAAIVTVFVIFSGGEDSPKRITIDVPDPSDN